ncbi:hypothetical protein ACFWDI_36305 [Streptomyces sp. NPDC060064]|uniref:hypothetical protein n=1 Tax=Streptomyces sp. NPDC060064 TaxID=3347049 RepID=UPI0036C74F38
MRVRMKASLSGTRDGVDWPKAGGSIELPDDEAEHLVAAGLAVTDVAEEVLPAEENAAAPADEEKAVPARKTTAPRKATAKK